MWCNCNNETFSLHWFFYKVIMKKVLSVWYDCTILFICFNSNVLLQGKQIDTNSLYFSTLSGSLRILYTLFLFTHMYQVLMNLTLCQHWHGPGVKCKLYSQSFIAMETWRDNQKHSGHGPKQTLSYLRKLRISNDNQLNKPGFLLT